MFLIVRSYWLTPPDERGLAVARLTNEVTLGAGGGGNTQLPRSLMETLSMYQPLPTPGVDAASEVMRNRI